MKKEGQGTRNRLNFSEWCTFSNTTDDCIQDEGFVDYITAGLCGFPVDDSSSWLICVYILYLGLCVFAILSVHKTEPIYLENAFLQAWLLYLFALLATITDDYFVPALNWIAFNLNLNENLAGITFVALGNGAPDIFGAMAAFTSATSETSSLAIGALLGLLDVF